MDVEVGTGGNREYKDALFCKIFGVEEHKKYLLSLYNALNHSQYENPEELELVTLRDVLFISMKNDVGFLIATHMNLYEHQSTLNENMPLRGFLYMGKLWQNWITKNQKNIYRRKRVLIPTPSYIVFYNGVDSMEEKVELKLSDSFLVPTKAGSYEFTATVYNINYGKNQELMESCQALREYAEFVELVREKQKQYSDLREAIRSAMEEAIERDYLDGYFKREKESVFMTTLYEVKQSVYEHDLREDAREEGLKEGLKEGLREGLKEGLKEGLLQGEQKFSKLTLYLLQEGKLEELARASKEEQYKEELYKKYGI